MPKQSGVVTCDEFGNRTEPITGIKGSGADISIGGPGGAGTLQIYPATDEASISLEGGPGTINWAAGAGTLQADGAANFANGRLAIDANGLINGVKVYRALLTQANSSATSGTLIVGHSYTITTLQSGDDFTNVGYVSEGVAFVATDTTPTVWSHSTSVFDNTASAPQATVLENSLGGTVVWTRENTGRYLGTLNGAFTANKTFCLVSPEYAASSGATFGFSRNDNDTLGLGTYSAVDIAYEDDLMVAGTAVQILVYP